MMEGRTPEQANRHYEAVVDEWQQAANSPDPVIRIDAHCRTMVAAEIYSGAFGRYVADSEIPDVLRSATPDARPRLLAEEAHRRFDAAEAEWLQTQDDGAWGLARHRLLHWYAGMLRAFDMVGSSEVDKFEDRYRTAPDIFSRFLPGGDAMRWRPDTTSD